MNSPLPFLFHPQSEVHPESDRLRLSLYLPKNVRVEKIWAYVEPDNEEELIAMKPRRRSRSRYPAWQGWHCRVPISPHSESTLYCFKVLADGAQYWCHGSGVAQRMPLRHFFFRVHQQQPPLWVREQIFYQIFVDRFHSGNPGLEPETRDARQPITLKEWGASVAKSHATGGACEFFGGDLQGVTQRLDYLTELGVTALYLNPVFSSPSNHKYDTTDYWRVDPQFGGNEALVELRQALSQRNMRLMLDAVINHTSEEHPWFDRFGGQGAFGNPANPYRNFYSFDEQGYAWCWKGCETLPKLNFAEEQVQQLLYKGEDAVIKYWLKEPFSIDGWRFDVIHMLGETTSASRNHHYVCELRQAIKSTDPQAYMIGEHIREATAWLQGDQEDGAMNYYGFTHPVLAFLLGQDVANGHPVRIDADELAHWFDESRNVIPFANQLAQFNLLDSHDTARFITLAAGRIDLTCLAVTLLLTYPGVPCVYYGDEVGLEGGHDPDNRRCFNWDKSSWNMVLRCHYQRLITLRCSSPELVHGDLIPLHGQGDVYAFARWLNGKHTLVVINRGDPCQINLDMTRLGSPATVYSDQFSQRCFRCDGESLNLDIGDHGALVLQPSPTL